MTSIELLKEIESWLRFNTEPSKEETAKLRKSIKEHLAEQLRVGAVIGMDADKYILWDKPLLSLHDIDSTLELYPHDFDELSQLAIKKFELAKERSKKE